MSAAPFLDVAGVSKRFSPQLTLGDRIAKRLGRAVGPRVVVPADTDADVLGSLPRWKVVEDAR